MNDDFFDELYYKTFDEISKYVICNCSNIEDASDIIQNIYMDVFKIINKDNYDLLSISYIKGIAKNKLKDYYRHNYKDKIISLFKSHQEDDIEDYKDENIDIEKDFLLHYDSSLIWKYLKKKSNLISKIFYLYYCMGLTINEISKELNINESNVKNYLYRTIKELRIFMEDKK